MMGMMGGPFRMPSLAESEAEKKKRAACKQVKEWVETHIPADHLKSYSCVVDVSEVACGDPNCSPIDTVVRIIYQNNCGTFFAVPCEAHEVELIDIEEMMPPAEYFGRWNSGERVQWPPPPENPEPGPIPDVQLRFAVGDRVECCISRGPDGWRPGVIVSHWYRAASWPTGQYAPYQVRLEGIDSLIFAPQDRDNCVRKAQQ